MVEGTLARYGRCVSRNVQGETPQQRAEGQKLAREWFAAHPRDEPPSPLNRLDEWLDRAHAMSEKG